MVFNIDYDAYQILDQYLKEVGKHLNDEEKDEILRDIEARLAELFTFKLNGRESVNCEDVKEIIEVMGSPEQYEADYIGEKKAEQPKQDQSSRKKHRKLYRNPNDKVIGGIASGLGCYFNIDPVVVRILFVALCIISCGWGLLVYLIFLIAMPIAQSKAQQLEMKGVEPSLENINSVNTESLQYQDNSSTLHKIIKICFIIFSIIIGVTLALGALCICIAIFVVWLIYTPSSFGSAIFFALLGSCALFLLCPAIGLAVLCIRAFKNGEKKHKWIGWTLLIVWILSLFGIIGFGIKAAENDEFDRQISTINKRIEHRLDTIGDNLDYDYEDNYDDDDTHEYYENDESDYIEEIADSSFEKSSAKTITIKAPGAEVMIKETGNE